MVVDPNLHTRLWAVAANGVYVSPDSGTTWTRTQLPRMPQTPLVIDAADTTYVIPGAGMGDAFVMKLDASGSHLVYSTYLGGAGHDHAGGIAVDALGRAYLAGETDSPDFPVAVPLQPAFGGDSDVFVSVLDPNGAQLVWSTYLGGTGAEGASTIALDIAGNVHVAGIATPFNAFLGSNPYTPPGDPTADVFVAKVKGDGSAVVFSTHFGGSAFDSARSVGADAAGNTYIAGATASSDLPVVNALQSALSGITDALAAEFDGQTGAVQYATYLGGGGIDYANGIAVHAAGAATVTGVTQSGDFPLHNPWQGSFSPGTLGFLATLAAQGAILRIDGVLNAASYSTAVAPGDLVSIFGAALAAGIASRTQPPLPTQLLDAHVTVNGIAAPLIYVSPQQVNAQIPFETQPGAAQLQVNSSAGTATATIQVTASAPAIFALDQQGTGSGAVLHGATNQVVTDANPAIAGEIISIYCTGLGAVNPPAQTGAAPPSPPPQTVAPVQVSIGGTTAQVLYAGVAPGFAGLYQVNARIPAGTPSGAQPLQVLQNGVASNTVTVAVH